MTTTTGTALDTLLGAVAGHDVVMLGQPLKAGVQRYRPAPPFSRSLTNKLGEDLGRMPGMDPAISGASDIFSMGTHVGTHMDFLNHVSHHDKLFDGTDIHDEGVQDWAAGIFMKTMDAYRPIVSRGVLLDFTVHHGVDALPRHLEFSAADMEACAATMGVEVRPGDTVLVRTGWDTYLDDDEKYLQMPIPGPGPEAAQWLVDQGVVAVGSDTMPFEAAPGSQPMTPHAILIPQNGVYIFEMLDLRGLHERRQWEFLFVALPLRLEGCTGSPINPVALVPSPAG